MDVIKREGFLEEFKKIKVVNAVRKACTEVGEDDFIAFKVADAIESECSKKLLRVEKIQDMVEDMLMDFGYKEVAKEYIKYRHERNQKRLAGWQMDELQRDIFERKYLQDGETFDEWIHRVSGGNYKVAKLIRQKKFLFAGRILSNRGLQHKGINVTLSNCYVLPQPEDTIEGIFTRASEMARTYSRGGGCGMDVSSLRPKGMKVHNEAKATSGATSFMQLYDTTTSLIGQNGRRGALMLSMSDRHPELEDFINIKAQNDSITKANISIRVSDDFMESAIGGLPWELYWENDNDSMRKLVNARDLFMKNVKNNWDWAEAGFLFWDRIEKWHLMSEHPEHKYAGVNPCGEEPLSEYGSCLLGAINLSEFVVHPFSDDPYVDYDKLDDAVRIAIDGLNEVLEEGFDLHPLPQQRQVAEDWRQIGLGVMGFHDMLIKLGLEYGSEDSILLSKKLSRFILNVSVQESAQLSKIHGAFPKYSFQILSQSEFYQQNLDDATKRMVEQYGLRNSQILTIAPTGSISTMFGVSGGIEPIFATKYTRKTESLHGTDVYYDVYAPIVKEVMDTHNLNTVPLYINTAHSVKWKNRLSIQSAWQQHIDASISSTVNLPKDTTVEETAELFIEAWNLGLKGVTIYRDGCKRDGILSIEDDTVELDRVTRCEECGEPIEVVSGACTICMNCGHSPCS